MIGEVIYQSQSVHKRRTIMSYSIPNITFTDEYFVHQRNLGQKVPDSALYPSALWSDVVLQDVPIEVTMGLANQDEAIMESLYSGPGSDERVPTRVGSRQSGPGSEIQMSESSCRPDVSYTANDYERVGSRERKIPQSHSRKYPVKPRLKVKEHRNKYFKHNQ